MGYDGEWGELDGFVQRGQWGHVREPVGKLDRGNGPDRDTCGGHPFERLGYCGLHHNGHPVCIGYGELYIEPWGPKLYADAYGQCQLYDHSYYSYEKYSCRDFYYGLHPGRY